MSIICIQIFITLKVTGLMLRGTRHSAVRYVSIRWPETARAPPAFNDADIRANTIADLAEASRTEY